MEIMKKEKTLAGMFLKYTVVFCVNTLVILILVYGLFNMLFAAGILLPANYAEQVLDKNTEEIKAAVYVTEEMIPAGSGYGVYDDNGNWLYGNLRGMQRENVWKQYREDNIYGTNKKYYRFIIRRSGEVCIVEYEIRVKFAGNPDKRMSFNADLLIILLFTVLFLLQAIFLSKNFAGMLKSRLRVLDDVTGKIAANNLDFEITASDIREINEVMCSLKQMKEALRDALQQQWEMERQREEQLTALAHDIKTPLTIIRGNAELLEESELEQEEKECNDNILENISEIEVYLEAMREVMLHRKQQLNIETISVSLMAEKLTAQAELQAAAKQMMVTVENCSLEGELEADINQIMRAWNNLVGNALDYTRPESGICIRFESVQEYLTASVADYGPGFTEQDIQHGKEEFYRGDDSRHDRSHQGLGLYIAQQLVNSQGGILTIGNSEKTGGAETILWMRKKSLN